MKYAVVEDRALTQVTTCRDDELDMVGAKAYETFNGFMEAQEHALLLLRGARDAYNAGIHYVKHQRAKDL